jgi:hypothetical protein
MSWIIIIIIKIKITEFQERVFYEKRLLPSKRSSPNRDRNRLRVMGRRGRRLAIRYAPAIKTVITVIRVKHSSCHARKFSSVTHPRVRNAFFQ